MNTFSTPERCRTQQTSNSAQDEILRVAAIDAALATAAPADLAALTADDVDFLTRGVDYDVQTLRLHSYV